MIDFIRRSLLHNVTLKLISLGLAIALWMALARDPIAEVAVDVPIEFHNISGDVEISSEKVPDAQIRLRGPERVIRRLRPSDVYVEIDLRNLRVGERTFDLTSQEVHQPRDLEVVQVIPSEFHIAFDSRMTRQVAIQPRVTGTFAPGWQIGRVTVEPSTLTIVGPKGHVQAVESAITDPIDVSGVMTSAPFMRHAYVSDPLVQVVNPDPVRITVMMVKPPASGAGH
jgi:YbbR domain-containing protein